MTERRTFVLEAPIGRAIWSLAWPLVLSNELSVVSTGILYFWLGHLLGKPGLVVDSLFSPFSLMVAWFFSSAAVGASVLVSRSVGASDGRGMSIASAATTLTLALWGIVALVLIPVSPWLADVLSGDLPVASVVWPFLLGWLLVELPAMSVQAVLFEVISATGFTKFHLARTAIEIAFIAALVPVLIGPVGLGIAGTPIAMGIGALGLSVVVWVTLHRRRAALGLGEPGGGGWRTRWSLWKELLVVGVPLQVGRIVMFAAELILVRLVMQDGETNVAGYGIARLLLMFGATATFAIAQGGAILIGQSLGAGREVRARRAIRTTLFVAWSVSAAFIVLTMFDRPIIEVFTSDVSMIDATDHAMSLMRWGFVAVATYQVMMSTFGAYRTTVRAGSMVIVGEAFGVALAFLLPGSRLDAVCMSFIASNMLKAVLLLALVPLGALDAGAPAAARSPD